MASIFRKSGYTAPTGGAFYRINKETGSSLYGQQLAEEEKRRKEEEARQAEEQARRPIEIQQPPVEQQQIQPTGIFQQAKNIAGSVAGYVGEGVSGFLKETGKDIQEIEEMRKEEVAKGSIFTKEGRKAALERQKRVFESTPVKTFMGGVLTTGSQAMAGILTSNAGKELDKFIEEDADKAQQDYAIMKDPNATDEQKAQAKARRISANNTQASLQANLEKNMPKEMSYLQAIGAGLETGVDIVTLGGAKFVAKGAKAGIGSGLKKLGFETLENVAEGAAGALGAGLKEGKTGKELQEEVAIGGAGAGLLTGLGSIIGDSIRGVKKAVLGSKQKNEIATNVLNEVSKKVEIDEKLNKKVTNEIKSVIDKDFKKLSKDEQKDKIYKVLEDNNLAEPKPKAETPQPEAKQIETPQVKPEVETKGEIKQTKEIEIGGEKKPIEKLTKEEVIKGIDEIKAKNKEVDANIKAEAEQAKMESVNIDVIDDLEGDLGRGLTKTEIKMVDEAQRIGDPASYDDMLTSFRTEKPPELQVKTDNNKQLNALKRQEKIINKEIKFSKTAKTLREKMINEQGVDMGETPMYKVTNSETEIKKALSIAEKDPQKAYNMTIGTEKLKGVDTSNSLSFALAEKAKKDGNIKMYAELTNSRSLRNTQHGKELAMEGIMRSSSDSPDSIINKLVNERLKRIKLPEKFKQFVKKEGKGRAVNEYIKSEATNLKKILKEKAGEFSNIQAAIDNITCKV